MHKEKKPQMQQWIDSLHDAAAQFNGGPRSFPLSSDARLAREYGYDPPNKDYQKLFFRQATIPNSQRDQSLRPRSAGWLIPDTTSVCRPVFVAHSTLAAIWLLRETLGDDALPSGGWHRLASAATSLARGDGPEAPPSAQEPPVSPLRRQGKRAAASTQTLSSPKRTCLVVEGTPSPSLSLSPPASSPTPSERSEAQRSELEEQHAQDPLLHTVTVTNNNRRAERERSRKLELKRVEKRRELGLLQPDVKASRQERAAYASITQLDEPLVAWIIKQPISDSADFYSTARTPYHTASTILDRARTLGNYASRYHAAQFLQAWRERGSPFRQGVGSYGLGSSDSLSKEAAPLALSASQVAVDSAFSFAWDMCNRSEGELAAVHIEYRWAAALLGKAYVDKIAQLRHSDLASSNDRSRNRYGKGLVRTEALASLLQLVSPNPTKRDRLVLRKRLARASRWYTVAQTLGWGSLALMPHDSIPNSWIESTLRTGESNIWVELVKKVNPDVFAASKALEAWLGPDGIAGGPISGKKTLSIEAKAPATFYEIEEVQDSEDEAGEGAETQQTQTQTPLGSPVSAAPLRQMTLLELFHPVE
jgi:hypothetical protein